MRIAYVFNSRMPTEKAHGVQIVQMCAAFASEGHDVTLIVPERRNPVSEDLFSYYGIVKTFRIMKVPVFDAIRFSRWLGPFALWMMEISFARSARRILREREPDLIYSRDTYSNLWVPDGPVRVTELHTLSKRFRRIHADIWKMSDRIVAMTEGLRKDLIASGIPAERVIMAHDAVDTSHFDGAISKDDARKALGLPLDRCIAIYVGRFYAEQGIDTLIDATERLSGDALVVMVGGMHAKGDGPNRKIVDRVSPARIPLWLRAADIALMPYVGTSMHILRYASPMKLFEYLGAGLPIITSDVPSVREVLSDEVAVFVPPDDSASLAEAIDALGADPERRTRMRVASKRLGEGKTWHARAKAVLFGVVRSEAARKCRIRWWPEISIVVLAFALRLIYVLGFPQHPLAGGDSGLYLGYADWMRGAVSWDAGWFTTFQTGYPAFLALIRTFFGESLTAIRIAQAFIGTATVGLVMWAGNRWSSRMTGIVAGILLAVHVPSILQTGIILTEGLYAFLITALIFAVMWSMEHETWGRACIAGTFALASGVTREIGYYAALVLVVFTGWKKAWKTASMLILMLAIGIIATAPLQMSFVPQERAEIGHALIAKGYEQTLVYDQVFRENALNPGRLMMWPEGIARFLLVPYRLTDVSGGVSMKSILLAHDSVLMREWPELLAKSFITLMHLAIIVCGCIGLARGRISRDLKTLIVLLGIFFAGSIILASVGRPAGFDVYAPLARYRFPLMPLIILIAAAGAERIKDAHVTLKDNRIS